MNSTIDQVQDQVQDDVVVAAFYKFVDFEDFKSWQATLMGLCNKSGVKGSILLASEGINGTVAGSRQAIDAIFAHIRSDGRFSDLIVKESFCDFVPFLRMKVRLKKEIVALRKDADPNEVVGTYIDPADWNEVISEPGVLLIDTRNDEEFEVGTFKGAVNPKTEKFSDFPEYVATLDPDKYQKVAMFCTGGIRCEKATSYLLRQGFENVMHLNGGILNYLAEVPKQESLWEGECFVFDERVSVDHDLKPGKYVLCRGCRYPLSQADIEHNDYEEGVCCAHCRDSLTERKAKKLRERHRQMRLAEKQGKKHLARTSS